MSDKIYDGGPAFPPHPNMIQSSGWGMSLRDYVAAAALTGMYSNPAFLEIISRNSPDKNIPVRFNIATEAYRSADAMLIARDVK